MGRRILIALLALGALFGFVAGFRSWRHPHGHWGRHAELEAHVAEVCVGAARRVLSGEGSQTASPKP